MFLRSSPRLPWFLVVATAVLIAAQWATAPLLHAQTFDATNLRGPTELGMTWLVHAGDDPAYARPDFDDSQWTRFDPSKSLNTVFPNRRPQVVWYRLHIKVAPNQTGLALEEFNIGSAFEIYVNGERLIQVGRVAPFVPYTHDARLLKRIPETAIATGSLVIALRVHIASADWASGFPGLYAQNLVFGQHDALASQMWLAMIGENALPWFYELTGLGLAIVALALFLAQPRQREYLWIFLAFLSLALNMPFGLYRQFHTIPAAWAYVYVFLGICNVIFLTLMYFALLRVPLRRWIQVLLVLLVIGGLASAVETARGVGSWLATILTVAPYAVLFGGVIPVLLIVYLWRGNREAGILLIPAVLSSLMMYLALGAYLLMQIPALAPAAVHFEQMIFEPSLGPFRLSTSDLGDCLFVLSLGVIIILRSSRITHQQAVLEGEVAAAREVQRVILPEQMETVPGFKVESIYQPAEQVGGDFFQVLPAGKDGLLVVVGDVAGKGLSAAMLVSVLVGAIRAAAEYTVDPAELLANLNERMVGRSGGFSTAIAAHIGADGLVTAAAAGHLPPYLDGREIELPSALPLGVRSGARYETVRLQIAPGSRLTFYSDGIVEAQKQDGEMFGFERAREFSTQPAAAIVEAARQFGQQDDMTVVTIERAPALIGAPELVLEAAPSPVV